MYSVLYNMLTGMAVSGALPSVITTLQQVYGFSSTSMGVLIAIGDAFALIISIPLGHYGLKWNKARVTTYGCMLAVVGVGLFALPQFVTSKYNPVGAEPNNELLCKPSGDGNEYVAASP